MKIGIAGGGALGLLFASYLMEGGHKIHIWTRSPKQAEVLNEEGITRENNVYNNLTASSTLFEENVDAVIIAVKQYDLTEVFDTGLPDCPVLFIQNGMGHQDKAREQHTNPLFAVVTHGAMKNAPAHVTHTGLGEIIMGGSSKANPLAHAMLALKEPFSARWTDDIIIAMKKKLIVNAVVNPLTVIYEAQNKILLSNKEAWERAQILFKEAALVLDLPLSEWENVNKVIEKTRENRSSMLVDFLERRQMELDSINGYIVKEAERKGQKASAHENIMEEILRKEKDR
ncbi:ketopantoate reductase family protein [Alkalicoccus daliensis]|uniref:2-dehydropantoate 2-reductase n=1 Tax=Alkalicoccus daliensis TaxID=745820 RepID=A0A1G9ZTI3_9BACI|nr:2-dehydropantoate 2-reductase [Alkalicoccus daliensis]SDN24729.1 2-dehydropantoate 2-reductase [Alkalicoccus daliensis]